MPPLTLLIKPVSSLCNMRCRYCFYADEAKNRQIADFGRMTDETLVATLQRALAYSTGYCTIAFQGGEPTLAGLDFFTLAVHLAMKLNVNGCRIQYALQTNGYALDNSWAEFFAQNHFLVGVSLDGPKAIHDANRIDAAGRGTYQRVMHTIQLLKNCRVDFNILTVVSAESCKNIQGIHGFFNRNKLGYQQYIPCLDPLEEVRGQHPWSLTPPLFERYLKQSFDCWYQDVTRGCKKYHRYFDNLLRMMAGQLPEACGMLGHCGFQYIVEADGSVFPCDFYVLDQWKLGNLVTDDFRSINQKQKELGFVRQSENTEEDCRVCKWRVLCNGGCRRDRDYFQNGLGKNYFCTAYAHFFEYAAPRLKEILNKGNF